MKRTTMTPDRYRACLALRAQGFSQAKVAVMLGIPRTVVSYYESLPTSDRKAIRSNGATRALRDSLKQVIEEALRAAGYTHAASLTDRNIQAIERLAVAAISWPKLNYRRAQLAVFATSKGATDERA